MIETRLSSMKCFIPFNTLLQYSHFKEFLRVTEMFEDCGERSMSRNWILSMKASFEYRIIV